MNTHHTLTLFRAPALVLTLTVALLAGPPLRAAEEEDGEVVVIAELNRTEVLQFIEEVEDELFRLFNDINPDDAFDVFCRKETATGTNIPERVCEPRFFTEARAKNVNDAQFNADMLLTTGNLRANMQDEFNELTRRMEAAARDNPHFREVASILNQLRQRLAQLSQ